MKSAKVKNFENKNACYVKYFEYHDAEDTDSKYHKKK